MKIYCHYRSINFLLITATLLISGCASVPNTPLNDSTTNICSAVISNPKYIGNGKQGIELTNDCSTCLSVAFQYIDIQTNKELRAACYVPSETRVVYWQAAKPHLFAQKSCEVAKTEGFADIASAAELDADFRSGKCDLLGTYAD